MKYLSQKLFSSHLDPGEELLEVFHRHPFVMGTDMIKFAFFGLLTPLFLFYMFPEFALFFLLWIFVGIVRIFYMLMNWYHDALIITNVSLLKVEWFGFFHRSSQRLEYQVIEGISYDIKGFIKTVFNYGDVSINRSGGTSTIHFTDAMRPANIERLILVYQDKFVSHQTMQDSDALKNLLITLVRDHAKKGGGATENSESSS